MPGWYSFLTGAALKSMGILGAAWLAAWVLRRRSAAARRLVWTAASAALLALPLLSLALPAVRVPVAAVLPAGISFQATATATEDTAVPGGSSRAEAAMPVKPAPWRPDWRTGLILLWALGAAAVLAQMLAAWGATWRVRRRARRLDDPGFVELAATLGMEHGVELFETGRASMPMTLGIFRPAVFLPADAARWSPERRRMVLLHELAHVRHGDTARRLVARIALGLYWWNPLAWAGWRRFLNECERAADDLVLAAGARASEYAGHLLEIARGMQSPPAFGLAAMGMAWRSQLEGRLIAILDSGAKRGATSRAAACVAGIIAAAVVLPLAAVQAQETPPAVPADVDATIRAAAAQKNHEMLESAARGAASVAQYDTARKLLDSSLEIRAQVSGQQSVDYGIGLMNIANLERNRDRTAEAEAFYTKALAVMGDRPESGPALIFLGVRNIIAKNYQAAFSYFQRAEAADPEKAGYALMWQAIAEERAGNAGMADSLYQQAMLRGQDSADGIIAGQMYDQFLRGQGREADAQNVRYQAALMEQAEKQRRRGQPKPGFVRGEQGRFFVSRAKPVVANETVVSSGSAFRVGNGVSAPMLIHKIEPSYSEEARAAKFQGTVVLSVEIGPDGVAHNVNVVRGLGLGLDEKAIEAVSQWRFKPGEKDGQPVNVAATIEVNFRLM